MGQRYIYAFEEGNKEQKYLLGGKGANLAEMTRLQLPVPPGFNVTTGAHNENIKSNQFTSELEGALSANIRVKGMGIALIDIKSVGNVLDSILPIGGSFDTASIENLYIFFAFTFIFGKIIKYLTEIIVIKIVLKFYEKNPECNLESPHIVLKNSNDNSHHVKRRRNKQRQSQ